MKMRVDLLLIWMKINPLFINSNKHKLLNKYLKCKKEIFNQKNKMNNNKLINKIIIYKNLKERKKLK